MELLALTLQLLRSTLSYARCSARWYLAQLFPRQVICTERASHEGHHPELVRAGAPLCRPSSAAGRAKLLPRRRCKHAGVAGALAHAIYTRCEDAAWDLSRAPRTQHVALARSLAADVAQGLADGLACLFTRAMSGLSRVACDIADAGGSTSADGSPRDDAALGTAPAAAGTTARSSQAFVREDGDALLVSRHPAAAAGSAVLVDACCDAVAVVSGLRR